MKQHLIAAALGLALLGGVVAFALLPRADVEPSGTDAAADPSVAAARQAACREFDLGIAASSLGEALENVGVALDLESSGGDGGAGYADWIDTELVTAALTDVAGIASDAALTPQLPQEVYVPMREVVRLATELERSAVSGSVFVAGQVAEDREDLAAAVADVGQACA